MVNIKNRYKYWNLIKQIAVTDFKLKYQGSVLGYLWSLVKPLALFAVLYVVFTKIFKLGAGIPHYPIYLLLGVMIFGFWGEATSGAMNSIASKGDLIRKIYFPRIVLVISATITSLITFSLNMLVVIFFAYLNGVHLTWNVLWAIPFIIELYVFILGVSFFLSSFFVKFRDVGHIWDVVNQILFYATPLLYSIAAVPTIYARLMILSPLAQSIQNIRAAFIGSSVLTISDYWRFPFLPELLVLVIFVSGYYVFQKMAAKFAEEI
ncbi:MAG: ABC transporter permease [Bacillota bacterium]|nr:ABC transporter permease [Bacillota bacterium]